MSATHTTPEPGAAVADLSAPSVVRPGSLAEASEALRESDGPVLFRGGGTKLDWAGRLVEPHLVLSTAGLSGVLTHNAGDMTASVGAGTPLTELQEHLAEAGQWLALDPPTAAGGATIGGLLAAGDSGPSRLRYGGLRDLVIGVTLVLGDGTVARSGGHVIKNVAGYDLSKLVHGSLGSLALIGEVVLRLHPRSATSATVAGAADASLAAAASQRIAASPLEPAAVEWTGDGDDGGRLVVRVDGTPRAVAAATRALLELLAREGVDAEEQSAVLALDVWDGLAAGVRGRDGDTVLRLATLPSDLPAVAARVTGAATDAGAQSAVSSSVALGLHTVRLRGEDPEAVAQAAASVRQHALDHGGTVQLRRRPVEVEAHLDALGPAPGTVELLRRVKEQFDPAGRCAPGRFSPWY